MFKSEGQAPKHVTVEQLDAMTTHQFFQVAAACPDPVLFTDERFMMLGLGGGTTCTFTGEHAAMQATSMWQQTTAHLRTDAGGRGPQDDDAEEPPAAAPAMEAKGIKAPIMFGSFAFFPDGESVVTIPTYVLVVAPHQRTQTNAAISHHQPHNPDAAHDTFLIHQPLHVTPGDAQQCHSIRPHTKKDILTLINQAKHSETPTPTGQVLCVQPASKTHENWQKAVADVITAMRNGQAEKVVMARSERATFPAPLNAAGIAEKLNALYPKCWTYAIKGLVGASPEMLADVRDGQLHCLVLAGTDTPENGQVLMNSAKNRHEHALAVASAADIIRAICPDVHVPDTPELLILPNVSHLATHMRAPVGKRTSLQVAGQLHPTAAVCGIPRNTARDLIRQHEGLDRGRYAGPVGWMDTRGNGQWAIALRCGQIPADNPNAINIIAGGGIMPDSDPAAELVETKRKMRPMLQALGVENQA